MSVFSDPVDHWLPIDSLFANTARFYPERGFAESPLNESPTCLSNCELFSEPKVRSDCRGYCRRARAHFRDSLRPVADKCVQSRDPSCCKKLAGTNDFAYRFCNHERARFQRFHRRTRLGDPTTWLTSFILMLLTLGVLVIIFVLGVDK